MMKFFKLFRVIVPALLLWSCVEEIDLNNLNGIDSNSNRLIVEGSITTEKMSHVVKLSRTGPAVLNTPIDLAGHEKVTGAKVSIREGNSLIFLSEVDTLPGYYFTPDTVQGEVGKTYTLLIELDGQEYRGSSTIQPAEPFTPIKDLFKLPNRLSNSIPDRLEIFELEFGKVNFGVAAPAKQVLIALDPIDSIYRYAYFYEFPGLDPQGFLLNFAGDNEETFFVEDSEIFQIKYSMTHEHYKFISAVYDESQFRGGVYDRIQGNVPTNMSNGALGFFSASEVITRKFVVTGEYLK